jgi:membrane associated rhomboid family serine protease
MSASANGGGVAFFAHVGGFVLGYLIARLLAGAGSSSLIRAAHGEAARIV